MKRHRVAILCMVASALGAGCAAHRGNEAVVPPSTVTAPPVVVPPPVPPAPVVIYQASENDRLLAYYEHVRRLPSAELTREYDTVRQLYSNAVSDYIRVRYAMVLSMAAAPFNDDARALEALEPLLKNAGAALHNLAFILTAQIQEQRRGSSLQQKLDALKSLEKSLIEREPGKRR